jgi:hypothetical protein
MDVFDRSLRDNVTSAISRQNRSYYPEHVEEFENDSKAGATVKYNFATLDAGTDEAIITALLTFVTVTTFLAGFAVADFGGFVHDEWGAVAEEWLGSKSSGEAYLYTYLMLMAFVSGNAMYLSVSGVMIAAVYYRTRNQTIDWSAQAERACEPVTAALESLRGQRLHCYNEAIKVLYEQDEDYSNVLQMIYGDKSCFPSNYPGLSIRSRKPTEEERIEMEPTEGDHVWEIMCRDPAKMAEELAFRLFQEHSFQYTCLFYVAAQGMQAIRGCDKRLCVLVVGILGYWMWQMNTKLQRIYGKMRD